MPHSLTTLKDRATQLLTKYKSGALVTQYSSLTRPSHVLADPHHHQNWPFAGFGSPPSDRGRNQLQNEASPQEPSRSRMQNWWGYIFLLNSESGVKYSLWWFEIESTSRQRCVSYAGEKKQILLKRIIFHSLSIAQVRVCEVVIFRPLPHTCKQVLRKYQNHYSIHQQTAF